MSISSNNIVYTVQQIYARLKKRGFATTAPQQHYRCPHCHDRGYRERRAADGTIELQPCSCLPQRQFEARLAKSGISAADYARYRLDNYLADRPESKAIKRLARNYLAARQAGEGFAIFGNSGTGKTHICIALCQAITRQYSEPHYYFSYRSEIQKIKAVMYEAGSYERSMSHWRSVPNLYIDDLFKGAATDNNCPPTIQLQDRQIVYDLINARLIARKATMFSSEYSINTLLNIDEGIGSRIYQMTKRYLYHAKDDNRRLAAEPQR